MDVLKYLDILIGLAIVMVLLSPLVTGITQVILYIRDSRARFLGAGLRNLFLQLDYDAERWLKVTDTGGQPVSNMAVCIPGVKGCLTTDSDGRAQLPQTIPEVAITDGLLKLQLSASRSCNVELTLTPHGKPCNDPNAGYAIRRKSQSTPDGGVFAVSLPYPPLMCESAASEISDAVQQHPMIAKVAVIGRFSNTHIFKIVDGFLDWRGRKGEVIEREELIRILLEFAANEGSGAANLSEASRTILQNVLTLNNVPNPGKTLADIRDEAQNLEKAQPNLASHVRQTTAIITAAKSDFVGKINNWFDQTMDRVTERYALTARAWTVLAALIVALAVQIDSLDLLRRLSVDDKFRASLLAQAEAQEKHMEDAAKTAGDTQSAQARRDEIEQNLSELRTPDMAILPDHFIWQPTPEALLVRNPAWTYPYPKTYELAVGSASYSVTPRWKKDPLTDLQASIDAAGAPVTTKFITGEPQLFLAANDAVGVGLLVDQQGADVLKPLQQFAQARLVTNPAWNGPFNFGPANPLSLAVDENPPVAIQVSATVQQFVQNLRDALQQNAGARKLVITSLLAAAGGNQLILSAVDPKAREITLRWNAADPYSNILNETQTETRSGSVGWKDIEGQNLTLVSASGEKNLKANSLQSVVDEVNRSQTGVTAKGFTSNQLLLHSQRLGAIELRYKARDATTNILTAPVYGSVWETVTSTLLQRSMIGVALSWVLLSLGAPFWYDTLKDLLKLRPTIASKEEAQRNDRRTENKEPKAPSSDKNSKAKA